MKIWSVQIWLLFCGIMEFFICDMLKKYDYNILYFEGIKFTFYIVMYSMLNIYMMIKKWGKDIKLKINIAVSLALSSLSGAVTVLFFLKSEGKSVGWITFLIVYVATVILFFWMWTKSRDSIDEESNTSKGDGRKGIYTTGLLCAIGFGRIASDSMMNAVGWIALLFLVWSYAFLGLLGFIRCKFDFNKMDQNN